MALVRFKDLCIDVRDVEAAADFWGAALSLEQNDPLEAHPGVGMLRGATPQQTVWLNAVPEPKTVKNRVHLDLRAPSLDLDVFAGLARVTEPGELPWTVLRSPEGDEFCVFVDESVAAPRLKDLEVDAVDHARIGRWWAELLGGEAVRDETPHGTYTFVTGVPDAPFEDIDFAPVPEPKLVKNRLHWDVTLEPGVEVADLVDRGAHLLRSPDGTISWSVLTDPEGNEFCAFATPER